MPGFITEQAGKFDEEAWYAYNEPIWKNDKSGDVIGNQVICLQAKDIVAQQQDLHPNRPYYQDPDIALTEFIVLHWAWRILPPQPVTIVAKEQSFGIGTDPDSETITDSAGRLREMFDGPPQKLGDKS